MEAESGLHDLLCMGCAQELGRQDQLGTLPCPALPSPRRPQRPGCASLWMGGLQKLTAGWCGGRGGEQTGREEPRLLWGAEQQGGAHGTLWVWAVDGELQVLLPGA